MMRDQLPWYSNWPLLIHLALAVAAAVYLVVCYPGLETP